MRTNIHVSFFDDDHLAVNFINNIINFLAVDKFHFSEYMHSWEVVTYIGKASENISSSVITSE